MKKILTTIIIAFSIIVLSGCTQNELSPSSQSFTNSKRGLSETITDIANQLKNNNALRKEDSGTIAITTFVNLDKLNITTSFGRLLSESMFNELFVRDFNVAEFRGQDAITVNKNGEFYITRNSDRLRNEIPNTYVLIGTYTKMNNDILINVRIIDNQTGKIVTTAKSIYNFNYCSLDNTSCVARAKVPKIKRKIKIINN